VPVVDDLLLLHVLARTAPAELQESAERGEVYATGCWYYRLSRAVHRPQVAGVLSTAFESLTAEERDRARRALDDLPERIGLLSPRGLVPVMTAIDVGRPLNLLTVEALAAALVVGTEILVSAESALLRTAAEHLEIGYRVVQP